METISTAELIELVSILTTAMDTQFQYWLAVSFALIVAGYMVGSNISKRVRLVLISLYLLITIVFFVRYSLTGVNIMMLADELVVREVPWTRLVGTWQAIVRMLVILGGTVASVWFFYFGYKSTGSND